MGPTAFRDGIFSSSDPMSKYGVLLTTYSDGSLGATQGMTPQGFRSLTPKQRWIYLCRQECTKFTDGRRNTCSRRCVQSPRITLRQLRRLGPRWGLTKATAGLGELDATTMTVAGIGVAVVAGLLVLGSSKKRRR